MPNYVAEFAPRAADSSQTHGPRRTSRSFGRAMARGATVLALVAGLGAVATGPAHADAHYGKSTFGPCMISSKGVCVPRGQFKVDTYVVGGKGTRVARVNAHFFYAAGEIRNFWIDHDFYANGQLDSKLHLQGQQQPRGRLVAGANLGRQGWTWKPGTSFNLEGGGKHCATLYSWERRGGNGPAYVKRWVTACNWVQ